MAIHQPLMGILTVGNRIEILVVNQVLCSVFGLSDLLFGPAKLQIIDDLNLKMRWLIIRCQKAFQNLIIFN